MSSKPTRTFCNEVWSEGGMVMILEEAALKSMGQNGNLVQHDSRTPF